MTNWWRRLGAPGTIALATAVVVLAVTVVRLPGSSLLPPLPGLHEPDFSKDAKTKLAPLRRDFLSQRIGDALLARLAPAESRVPSPVRPPAPGGKSARPTAASTGQTAAEHNILANALAPGAWDLRLEFASDRDSVESGGDVVYTLTVRNFGKSAFNGRLDLRSHVPLFASYVADPVCAVKTVVQIAMSSSDQACPLPGLPLPEDLQDIEVAGQPVPLTGLTWTSQTSILPGGALQRSFKVTVNPGADGRDLVDHAHISVLGAPSQRSRDVVVHVINKLPVSPS